MSIYDSHRVYLIILPFVHCKENYGRSVNNNQIIRRQQKYSFICNCKVLLLSIIHIQDKPLCTLTGRENSIGHQYLQRLLKYSLEVKQVFIGRECRLSYLRAIKAIPRSLTRNDSSYYPWCLQFPRYVYDTWNFSKTNYGRC